LNMIFNKQDAEPSLACEKEEKEIVIKMKKSR